MELKEQYAGDKVALQKGLMDLYKKEKVNPAAGCLPILIQIPIFFSLFKVLNVAIEMRHAPGYFWINDLSAPDPTSLFNLFGLLPYDVPAFLVIGAWPCLMMITLILQQSMNPPPTDPVVRDMFRFMPYFMGFVMSGFAAGLVIYWTFTNVLSIIQQYTIMRMMGVEVKFLQGWFGREYMQNTPDIHRLGLSEELINLHKKKESGAEETKPSDENIEVSAPKPKKKKKKK
jgi:YidC/Oxa1 family membrane protein insertase